MAAALLRQARWLLVEHPAVASFRWQPGRTLGATPSFAAAVICGYLATVLLLRRLVLPLLQPPPPRALRAASAAHNAVLLALSAAMVAGCALSTTAAAPPPRWRWPFCFPPGDGVTEASGPVFFWAHVFYLSKVYELGDTLLILLGRRPLTLLHVYHHAVVIAMCYLWLATRQSLMPIALVTNAGVHVVMYAYSSSCSVGWRWPPRCKRAVTELQIVQFLFSFAASLVMLWLHFTDGGCEGMAGWVFNAVFNASLLALFLNFHGAACYKLEATGRPSREGHGEEEDDEVEEDDHELHLEHGEEELHHKHQQQRVEDDRYGPLQGLHRRRSCPRPCTGDRTNQTATNHSLER